jgi:parallel beta-helix repeat protein
MDCCQQRGSSLAIVVLASLFLSPALPAAPVDPAGARRAVSSFLQTRQTRPGRSPTSLAPAARPKAAVAGLREVRDDDGTLLAYVADLEPRGFVALAADTDLNPVIAYSFRSAFPRSGDRLHPLSRLLRQDMKIRQAALAEHPEFKNAATARLWDLYVSQGGDAPNEGTFQQWPPEGTTATGGWLTTAWVQDEPYNRFCPLDPADGVRTYVGCAATAFAQILNYHRQCGMTFGPSDAYVSYSGMQMDADSALYDFPPFATLNQYLLAVRAKYSQAADLNDVEAAALCFACGIAAKMDYSSEGSGASVYDVQDALLTKLHFRRADMFGSLSRASLLVLQENMMNRLPALVSIRPPDGMGGHVIVCDGYNTHEEYHLNFGWGAGIPEGITEVWYHLPSDLLSFKEYEIVITETILNIEPTAPFIDVEPAALSFTSIPGADSGWQTLRIVNNLAGAQVDSITSPAGFLIAAGTTGTFADRLDSVEFTRPQMGATIRVKFHPERAGGYYGTLAIHYNDNQTRYVILKGWSYTGGTEIGPGNVSGVWSSAKSPYFVTGNIRVPADQELTIEPGVQVFFTGPFGLTVGEEARLLARGEAARPIEFTAWNREVGWGGLRFLDSGNDDLLRYCSLTWAKKTTGLIPPASDSAAEVLEEDSHGGAVYCSSSDLVIENCRLTNNVGDGGGAIYCTDSYPFISNTLIANNTSLGDTPRCGGICSEYGALELYHCTIVNNSPGGILASSCWNWVIVTNTIAWGNELYQIAAEESTPEVTFCDVQGGCKGKGNFDADPCFFSPSAGPGIEYDGSSARWALQSRSPCINAGTEFVEPPATDLAGAARKVSGVLDLGAYENQSELPLLTITPALTADAGFVKVDASKTIRLEITNTGTQDFTVESVGLSDANEGFSLPAPVERQTLAAGQSLPVEITFQPKREEVYRARLDVRSTASNGAHVPITLKGVGVVGTIVPPGWVSGTWRKASSPYVVTGDIYIDWDKLTVEPGVTVKFAGHFWLMVGYRGTLRAIGTEQDRIVFTALDKEEGWYGIRLINSGSDDKLRYCTLEYAKKPRTGGSGIADLFGGAILCYASFDSEPGYPVDTNPTIDSCLLTHNCARTGGAIACMQWCDPLITGNIIIDNEADYDGAGIALYYSYGTVANNVIVRNAALAGGGLMNIMSSPSVVNNTFVANRPGALHLESVMRDLFDNPETMQVVNNILWKNEIYLADTETANYEIRFNNIPGGWEGEGNIDQDPRFANPSADDYHLKSQAGRWDPAGQTWVLDDVTSPCLDAGDPALDPADEPEPNGGRIDMGAYGGTDQASKSPAAGQ